MKSVRWLLLAGVVASALGAGHASGAPPLGTYLHISWDKTPEALYRVLNALDDLGYQFIFLEVGGNLRLDGVQGLEGKGAWTPQEVRAFIRAARSRGIRVYPVVSLLSHPECGPQHPRYVDPQLGLRLWEDGVYDFVRQVVVETLRVFRDGQAGPMYFHVRLDEAREVVAANAERLGRAPDEVLADHVLRLREIIGAAGARMVMYHDMLLSPEDVRIGTALGGPPVSTARALDRLPRDIVINFWLYDFMAEHAPAIEHFTRRGFPVWVSPWLAPELGLSQYARQHGLPVVGTTWCPLFGIGRHYSLQRALFTTGYYLRHPGAPAPHALPFSPRLRVIRSLAAPAPCGRQGVRLLLPALRPTQASALAGALDGFPERPIRAVSFLDPSDPAQAWEQQVLAAPRPLRLEWGEGRRQELAGVNIDRGEGAFVLYTPAHGRSTRTNPFGGEIVLVEGLVREASLGGYGLGDQPIPPGGCVISAHVGNWTNPALLDEMTRSRLTLVDAEGRSLLPAPASEELQESSKVTLPIPDHARTGDIVVHHGTVQAAMPGRALGEIRLVGSDGAICATPVVYGQNVAAFRMPEWLMASDLKPVTDAWLAWSDDRGGQPRALVGARLRMPNGWRPRQVEFVPTNAGRCAGWTVLAVVVDH